MSKIFASSYSGGKDSMLALHRAVKKGYTAHSLLTTYNTGAGRSWFHGITIPVLEAVSVSLGLPLTVIKTDGSDYQQQFEQTLLQCKGQGVTSVVFGDIDIDSHRAWCESMCQPLGLEALFPLWQEDREELVYEFIDLGYTAYLNVVDTQRLDASYAGKILTRQLAKEIQQEGADICGENGEYHSFVSNGPLFTAPVPIVIDKTILQGQYACAPISLIE